MTASASGDDDPFAIGVVEWTLDVVRSRVASEEAERRLIGLLAATDREQHSLVALWDSDRALAMGAGRDVLESRGYDLVVDAEADPSWARHRLLDLVGLSADRRRFLVVETAGGDDNPTVTREVGGVAAQRGSAAYLNDSLHRDTQWLAYLRQEPGLASGLADGSVLVEYLEVFGASDGRVEVSSYQLPPGALRLDDLVLDGPSGSAVAG